MSDLGALSGGQFGFIPDAFFVYKDADQTVSGLNDIITWDQADYNYNTCFDLVTNHRFTPNKKGLYSFTIGLFWTSSVARFNLFKTGSLFYNPASAAGSTYTAAVPWTHTFLIELNGTTDYVDARMDDPLTGSPVLIGASPALRACYFTGHPVFLY